MFFRYLLCKEHVWEEEVKVALEELRALAIVGDEALQYDPAVGRIF